MTAQLCWKQHGGSGYNFTKADIESMDLQQIEFYLNWQRDRREAESKAIEAASKKK